MWQLLSSCCFNSGWLWYVFSGARVDWLYCCISSSILVSWITHRSPHFIWSHLELCHVTADWRAMSFYLCFLSWYPSCLISPSVIIWALKVWMRTLLSKLLPNRHYPNWTANFWWVDRVILSVCFSSTLAWTLSWYFVAWHLIFRLAWSKFYPPTFATNSCLQVFVHRETPDCCQ